ncbi:MAG: acetyl-CoA carboxylase biotin carboxyl carrier protein [Burkholderiales bacterium]
MDLRKVKTLIDLVQQSGISELEIQEGEERVRISRGPVGMAGTGGAPQMMAPQMVYAAAPPATPEVVEAPAELQGFVLKSPMVGTFYRSSAPGEKPFVEIGQTVKTGDTVCIIEAMKLLNEIEGGADGVIKEILVENGQPVEYGQPLMVIA